MKRRGQFTVLSLLEIKFHIIKTRDSEVLEFVLKMSKTRFLRNFKLEQFVASIFRRRSRPVQVSGTLIQGKLVT
jgi:hypothetical protein